MMLLYQRVDFCVRSILLNFKEFNYEFIHLHLTPTLLPYQFLNYGYTNLVQL